MHLASWVIELIPRCNLLTKGKYMVHQDTVYPAVYNFLNLLIHSLRPRSSKPSIWIDFPCSSDWRATFLITCLLNDSTFHLFTFPTVLKVVVVIISTELKSCPFKYCPPLKRNQRHLFHPYWLLWKHTEHSLERKHRESYWNSQRNSQRNSHRQERSLIASAFLPYTCKERSRLFSQLKLLVLILERCNWTDILNCFSPLLCVRWLNGR